MKLYKFGFVVLAFVLITICPYFAAALDSSTKTKIAEAYSQLEKMGHTGHGYFTQTIAPIGSDAVPELMNYYQKSNPEVKSVLIRTSMDMDAKCEAVAGALTDALSSSHLLLKIAAISFVGGRGCNSFERELRGVIQAANNNHVLKVALFEYGGVAGGSDASFIESYQNNASLPVDIRLVAAKSLLQVAGRADLTLIGHALKAGGRSEKEAALAALAFSRDQNNIRTLEDFLRQPQPDPSLAMIAESSIEEIKINTLSENYAVRRDKLFENLRSEKTMVRNHAFLRLLGRYKNDDVVNRLRSLAADTGYAYREEVLLRLMSKGWVPGEDVKSQLNRRGPF